MKRLKKLAIIVGCRFFIAMCLCMFAGVDIIYAQHAESDSITGKVHQIPDVTVSVRKTPQAVKATSPLQVMGKMEMERLGVHEVADAVRHFSGVTVREQILPEC
jgi:outer membrane receptor for ferrienterochelin and colicin